MQASLTEAVLGWQVIDCIIPLHSPVCLETTTSNHIILIIIPSHLVYVSLVTLAGHDKRSRHVNAKPRGSPDRERKESGASRFSRMLRARAQQLVFNLVNIAIF